jgi:hypothetical protein
MPDDQPQILQDLGPLNGLPGDARFIPVIGKRPTDLNWNSEPAQWLTAEQIVMKRNLEPKWTGSGLMTGSKVGRLVWLDFDGEEVSETGEITKSATQDFYDLFYRPVTDLPPCPISISGRPGRFRALMKMPEGWTSYFRGFSIASGEMPTKAFEFLYEKAGGKLFHAVVEGDHPDGQGWYYRWQIGKSPAEVEIPDLPEWVIAGLVRHMASKAVRRQEREESKSERNNSGESAFDLLAPGKQRKLLMQMQDYWPFRGGEANTGYSGEYDRMRRLILSLAKGIDDWKTFKQWLVGEDWDDKNDWDGSNGSHAVNGGDLESYARSLMRSDTQGDPVEPWGAAWNMAKENGWKPPTWALPPREIDASTLALDSAKLIRSLEEGLMEIDLISEPAQRLAAQQELARTIGKSGKDMAALLQAIEEGEESWKPMTGSQLLELDPNVSACITGLLAKSCLTVVASEGGGAKTSLCYRLATAIATGGLFADKMQAEKGKVLVIQKDETTMNARQKVGAMDWDSLPKEVTDNIQFRFSWHPGMFPELRKVLKDYKPALVVMDSLGTLMGGAGASLNDAEVALYLYRLNKMAAEFDTSIVLTHHTRKAQTEKKKQGGEEGEVVRKRAKISDLYGSAYIVNAATDVWALGVEGGDSDAPVFALQVLKARSGVTQTSDTIHFQGNLDDLSFEFTNFNMMKAEAATEVLNGTAEQKVLQVMRKRSADNPITEMELLSQVGVSSSTIKRVVRSIYGQKKRHGINRKRVDSDVSGPKPFGYFAE